MNRLQSTDIQLDGVQSWDAGFTLFWYNICISQKENKKVSSLKLNLGSCGYQWQLMFPLFKILDPGK